MNFFKHLSLSLLLGAAVATSMTAAAQSTATQSTPWDGKTYQWVDAQGVTHTAYLTDKATDPRQIQALLGAVYTDPTVPGQNKHNEYLEDGTPCAYQMFQRNINYDDHGHAVYHYVIGPNQRGSDVSLSTLISNPGLYFKPDGFEWENDEQKRTLNKWHATKKNTEYSGATDWDYIDWVGERTEPIPNPVEGMTVLLVEVKDTWDEAAYLKNPLPLERAKSTLPFIEEAIKSVQLMTQWMRVNDDVNPGYVFLADEVTTNRFFFISKGRTRRSDTRRSPFGVAYEIVSPRQTQLEAENLNNGQVERVEHDCYSVFQQGNTKPHYVELDGNEASTLSKLTLFMPDKRFRGLKYNPTSNKLEGDLSWYTNMNFPEWNYQNPAGETDSFRNRFKPGMLLYKAFLNAEAVPSQTDGYYDIKLDWRTWFDASKLYTNVAEQYYVYILDADGKWQLLQTVPAAAKAGMGETTRYKTFTYPWPIQDHVQTFTYMITANPIDVEGDDITTVSNIKVNSNTATVIIPGRTKFFVDASDYRSRFALDDENIEANVYRNRPKVIVNANDINTDDGQQYSLHRIALDDAGKPATDTEIATIQFTQTDGGYGYTVNYSKDTQVLDPIFDSETSTDLQQSGTVAVGKGITIVDRFTASTETNDHPAGYIYVVKFKEHGGDVSNRYPVPVMKSECVSHFAGFTREQVDGDTQHQLVEENEVWVDFTVTKDKERTIERYDVHRVNDNKNDYHARIGKAERTNDNNLAMIGINHATGHLSVDLGSHPIHEVEGKELRFYDDCDYCPFDNPRYVTEIFAGTRDWAGNHTVNTYGTNISRVGVPQLSFQQVGDLVHTKPMGNTNPVMGYSAQLVLIPNLTAANDIDKVYYYRIWRVEDDGTETLLNGLENVNETEKDYVHNYVASYSGIQSQWLSATAPVTVIDTYLSSPIPLDTKLEDGTTVHGTKDVTYVARMYSTMATEQQESDATIKNVYPHEGGDNIYYVTEKRLTITYDDQMTDVVTALDAIAAPAQVVSTRYYNLQGAASTRPFTGVNIVVDVRADGTVTSRKVLY